MAPTLQATRDVRRKQLLNGVGTLNWFQIPLTSNATIWVTNPVSNSGVFIPVTAKETFDLAKAWDCMPLTRAVSDRCHNEAVAKGTAFGLPSWKWDITDFDGYSKAISPTYGAKETTSILSGAHKVWVLSTMKSKFSSKPKAVNYGFHYKGAPTQGPSGATLQRGFAVTQALGTAHDGGHWDYSQMLQVMWGLEVDGTMLDLRTELLAGNPAIWDESTKLSAGDLP